MYVELINYPRWAIPIENMHDSHLSLSNNVRTVFILIYNMCNPSQVLYVVKTNRVKSLALFEFDCHCLKGHVYNSGAGLRRGKARRGRAACQAPAWIR